MHTNRAAMLVAAMALVIAIAPVANTTGTTHQQVATDRSLSFDAGGVSEIRFQSDLPCELNLQCWNQSEARFSWTIEAVSGAKTHFDLQSYADRNLKVVAESIDQAITVRLIADSSRFAIAENEQARITDTATGVTWKVSIRAHVPCQMTVDTTLFKGVIRSKNPGVGDESRPRKMLLSMRNRKDEAISEIPPDVPDDFRSERAVYLDPESAAGRLIAKSESIDSPVEVSMLILVDEDGRVKKARIVEGDAGLEEPAQKAVSSLRFFPVFARDAWSPFVTRVKVRLPR